MKSRIIVFSLLTCLLFSCQKEFVPPPIESSDVNAISPEKLKNRIDVLKEVSSVLMEVYKDPVALYEVNAAIYSEYYADETVLLRDLLYPETSPIYKSNKFLELKPKAGVFRAKFAETFLKGSYPTLRNALGNAVKDLEVVNNSLLQRNASRARTNLGSSSSFDSQALFGPYPSQPDTAREIFSNSAGASIYFPYSENYGSDFTPAWFDAVNTDPNGRLATIVTADREADSGPGQRPRRIIGVDNQPTIEYKTVTIDDNYVEKWMTHIVGVGAEPNMPMTPPPPVPTPGVNRVYIGEMRCNLHLDWLISSQGRGGGNDVVINRISGYLQQVNSQVTSTTADITPVSFKRRDVRKGNWKRVYAVWDADWRSDNFEQVLFIYEDDNNVTKKVTGTIETTAKVSDNVTIKATLTYDVTLNNVDVIMKQLKISRNSYFTGAYSDQGWGFRPDLTFIPPPAPHGWPIYDGSTSGYVSWTWPYQVIQ
jgi:hypothetical protein